MSDSLLKRIQDLEKENMNLNKRIEHLETLLNVKKKQHQKVVDVKSLINERLNLFNTYWLN